MLMVSVKCVLVVVLVALTRLLLEFDDSGGMCLDNLVPKVGLTSLHVQLAVAVKVLVTETENSAFEL